MLSLELSQCIWCSLIRLELCQVCESNRLAVRNLVYRSPLQISEWHFRHNLTRIPWMTPILYLSINIWIGADLRNSGDGPRWRRLTEYRNTTIGWGAGDLGTGAELRKLYPKIEEPKYTSSTRVFTCFKARGCLKIPQVSSVKKSSGERLCQEYSAMVKYPFV